MLFRQNNEHEREIWVDRGGLDARVDSASICEPCDGLLRAIDPRGEDWHDMESRLCPECRVNFQARALAVDLFGLPRPFNGDIEGRFITNEEFAEEARPGLSEAFGYFLPDRGDGFPSALLDRLPRRDGDVFGAGPTTGFLALPEEPDRPSCGEYSFPDMEDYLLPE